MSNTKTSTQLSKGKQKKVLNLLDIFEEDAKQDYTDERYNRMADTLRQLSPFIDLDEYKVLGTLWRKGYAEGPDLARITQGVNLIRSRFMKTE